MPRHKLSAFAVAALLLAFTGRAAVAAGITHECIRFDPIDVNVIGDTGGYALTAGDQLITEVHGSRAEARLAVYIIRFYGIDEFCSVSGKRQVLGYYLVNGFAPRGRSPSDDCVWFDAAGARLIDRDGLWTFVDRNDTALSLGPDETGAQEAVRAIRQRNFSEICFVGRPGPSMIYFVR